MDSPTLILSLSTAAGAAAAAFPKLHARLALSRAKHRSLTGHSKMSRAVARLIPHYEFDIDDFFRSDGAPAAIATQRQDAFFRLASLYEQRYPKGRALTKEAAERIGADRLDFLAQEFNREVNTCCSKSNDIELTNTGLEMKNVVEQFREQVQNLE